MTRRCLTWLRTRRDIRRLRLWYIASSDRELAPPWRRASLAAALWLGPAAALAGVVLLLAGAVLVGSAVAVGVAAVVGAVVLACAVLRSTAALIIAAECLGVGALQTSSVRARDLPDHGALALALAATAAAVAVGAGLTWWRRPPSLVDEVLRDEASDHDHHHAAGA